MTFLVGAPSAIIVDDDKDTVTVFSDYLKLKKVNVLGVGFDGNDAVNLYKKLNPDIVFLDHMMPEYDGLYALYNIRKQNPNAHVVMITADNTIDENPKILELEPTAIVHKPFKIDEIMKLVEEIVEQKPKVSNSS